MRKAPIANLCAAELGAGVLAGAAPAPANPILLAPFFSLGAAVCAAPPAVEEGPAIGAPAGLRNCPVVNRPTAMGCRGVEVCD
jgi:hypothetical protein